jgi:hypothetical protein
VKRQAALASQLHPDLALGAGRRSVLNQFPSQAALTTQPPLNPFKTAIFTSRFWLHWSIPAPYSTLIVSNQRWPSHSLLYDAWIPPNWRQLRLPTDRHNRHSPHCRHCHGSTDIWRTGSPIYVIPVMQRRLAGSGKKPCIRTLPLVDSGAISHSAAPRSKSA